MAFLKDFKLGDMVFIYLDSYGKISRTKITNRVIPATIYAVNQNGKYYLGWKEGDTVPKDKMSSRNGMNLSQNIMYADDQNDYGQYVDITKEELSSFPVQSSSKVEKIEMDISSSWRAWAHNVPGECACGIPRAICTYHKE